MTAEQRTAHLRQVDAAMAAGLVFSDDEGYPCINMTIAITHGLAGYRGGDRRSLNAARWKRGRRNVTGACLTPQNDARRDLRASLPARKEV